MMVDIPLTCAVPVHPLSPRHYGSWQTRRILRLARLAFPAIRVDHTRLTWTTGESCDVLVRMKWDSEVVSAFAPPSLLPLTPLPRVRLHLRPWCYQGKRRCGQLTLAYEPTQGVCVVMAESVRVWKREQTWVEMDGHTG